MRGRIAILAGLTTLLLALTLWVGVPATAAITGTITLALSCGTDPERTTITNNTDEPLDLGQFTLTSIVNPRAGVEPVRLSGTLAVGASITFESDAGAATNSPTTLTRQAIYVNTDPVEGAILSTPFGPLQVLCGARTGTLQVNTQPATATATTAATTVATSTTPPRTPATVPATVTLAPTRTIPPGTAVTTVPLAPATPVPTVAAAPTATVVMPRGLPNTGAGGGASLTVAGGTIAATFAVLALLGEGLVRGRRGR